MTKETITTIHFAGGELKRYSDETVRIEIFPYFVRVTGTVYQSKTYYPIHTILRIEVHMEDKNVKQ